MRRILCLFMVFSLVQATYPNHHKIQSRKQQKNWISSSEKAFQTFNDICVGLYLLLFLAAVKAAHRDHLEKTFSVRLAGNIPYSSSSLS